MKQLILLHGFTGSSQNWQPFLPALSAQFQVFTPDIVGHGKAPIPSAIEPYRMENAAQAILGRATETFHLLGYSMGGRLALYIAMHYPERLQSLILESASPGLKTEAERAARKKHDDDLADKIEANGMQWFVDYWESLSLWNTQSVDLKAGLRQQRLQNDPKGLANSLRGMGTGVMPPLWDNLPDLTMPVKLIVGESDTKFVAINQEMAKLIPYADLSIVSEAGHTLHLEQPEAFSTLILEFLRQNS